MLMTLEEILATSYLLPKITITGGEPLLHGNLFLQLLEALLESGRKVSIETNGTQIPYMFSESKYQTLYRYIVDYKLPSSGMMEKMNRDVFDVLRPVDVMKFVICNAEDYDIAKVLICKQKNVDCWRARKVFSPGIENQRNYTGWPACLAENMIRDSVQNPILADIQYSLQIHKVLWPYAIKER
jgi:7-carboxy-7-deazaguanine synthase